MGRLQAQRLTRRAGSPCQQCTAHGSWQHLSADSPCQLVPHKRLPVSCNQTPCVLGIVVVAVPAMQDTNRVPATVSSAWGCSHLPPGQGRFQGTSAPLTRVELNVMYAILVDNSAVCVCAMAEPTQAAEMTFIGTLTLRARQKTPSHTASKQLPQKARLTRTNH